MFRYVCFDSDKSRGKLVFLQKSKKGIVIVEQTNLPVLQSDIDLKKINKILTDTNLFKDNLVFFDMEVLLYSCEIGLINDLVQLLIGLSRLKKKIVLILNNDDTTKERVKKYYPEITEKLNDLGVFDKHAFIIYEQSKKFEQQIITIICKENGLEESLFQEVFEEENQVIEKYHLTNEKVKILFYNAFELTEKDRFASYISLTYPRILRILLDKTDKIAVNFLSLHKSDSLMDIKREYGNKYNLIEYKDGTMKGLSALSNLEGNGISFSFANELNEGNRLANIVYDVVYDREDIDLSQYNQIFFYIRNLEEVNKVQNWLVEKAQNLSARPAHFTTYFVIHYKRQDLAYSAYQILKEKFNHIKIIISNPMTDYEGFGIGNTLNKEAQVNRIKEWEAAFSHFMLKEETHLNTKSINVDAINIEKEENENDDSPAV